VVSVFGTKDPAGDAVCPEDTEKEPKTGPGEDQDLIDYTSSKEEG
jgi:hypothetical protein